MGDEKKLPLTLDNTESQCISEDTDEKSERIINELFSSSKNGKVSAGDEENEKETLWMEKLTIDDSHDDDDEDNDDEVFLTTTAAFNRRVMLDTHSRNRGCISECSNSGRPSSDGVIASSSHRDRVPFRRDRSVSEPAPHIVDVAPIARELRRISDEFHSLYTPPETRPSTSTSSGGSPFSNAGTRLLRNLREHVFGIQPVQPRPIRRQRSYSETHPPGHYN